MKIGLTNTRTASSDKEIKANTQVKMYIITYLLPKAINKSLEFVTPELTVLYLEMINRAQEIEEHLKNYDELKFKHMEQIQQMHQQLIQCKGVKFSKEYIEKYDLLFKNFIGTFKSIRKESLRLTGMQIFKRYMDLY